VLSAEVAGAAETAVALAIREARKLELDAEEGAVVAGANHPALFQASQFPTRFVANVMHFEIAPFQTRIQHQSSDISWSRP